MKIDSHRIDQMLERIAHGELDPLQAARNLLGMPPPEQATDPPSERQNKPPSVQRQTLDQLVRTLGMPPPEIEQDWRQQIQTLAHTWQQAHGVPLPALQLSELWVDADNRLSLRNEALATIPPAAPSDLADEPDQTPPDASTPTADTIALAPTNTPASRLDSAQAPRLSQRNIAAAATALAACAAAAVLWGTYFRADAEPRGHQARTAEGSHREVSSGATSAAPSASPARPGRPTAARTETLAEPRQTLMPPSILPADTAVPADLLEPDDPLADETVADTEDVNLDEVDTEADDAAPLQEAPQHRATRSATADAVALPPLPTVGQSPEPARVFDSPVSELKSEPFRFRFAEPQDSVSWSLPGPAVFAAAELTADVDVPDSVQLVWIEPLDPHNLRRSVGLLQWSPTDSETPRIRCRLELRVAANLSLKLRYAAQLDPALPWQTFSPEQLEQTVDRAAVALNRLLTQQSDLARQYTAASTASRRLLKPTKDAVDQNVQQLQTLLQRMQQLIELQTAVATEAQLRIKLTTQRPDQPQTILELTGEGE